MIFREAELQDKQAVYTLANQLHDKIQIQQAVFDRAFEKLLKEDQRLILVAESNKEVLGYLSAYSHFAIYNNGNVLFVDEVVVLDTKRGRGIGTGLMKYLEKKAAKYQCDLIALATFGAGTFYQSLGYRTKAGYYKKYLQ